MQSNTYRSVLIIYFALIAGMLIFGLVILFAFGQETHEPYTLEMLGYIAITLSIVGPAAGQFLYTKQIAGLRDATPLFKLTEWRSAVIIRSATTEAPCLFAGVGYMLHGATLFLIIYVVMLAWMFYNWPGRIKVMRELSLTEDELNEN